jgi:hypothetical protein
MVAVEQADFGPPDWLSLNVAYRQIREGWGSSDIAASELHRLLLDGRLKSAGILRRRDGRQERQLLDPDFWRQFDLAAAVDGANVRCRPKLDTAITETWYFFVRRSDLDTYYAPTTPAQAVAEQRKLAGRPTKYDWHKIDGEIARRCIDPKTKKLKIPKRQSKLVTDVSEWCDQEFKEKTPGAVRWKRP